MASFSTTELNATIDEKWDMDVNDARYANATIMPRINNRTAFVTKSGDIINITVQANYTVGDVGSNGAFVPQITTPSSFALTINQHRQVSIEVEDRAKAVSFWDPASEFPRDAGKALAADVDNKIGALQSGLTSNIVGSSSKPPAFDTVAARAAMLKLADTNIPLSTLSFILPPIAFYNGIFTETQLTSADHAGLPKNVLTNNFRFPLLGVPAFETTNLTTSGTAIKGMLIHRDVFAVAFSDKNIISRADRTSALVFSFVVAIRSLYGLITVRQDHGVLINIRNT